MCGCRLHVGPRSSAGNGSPQLIHNTSYHFLPHTQATERIQKSLYFIVCSKKYSEIKRSLGVLWLAVRGALHNTRPLVLHSSPCLFHSANQHMSIHHAAFAQPIIKNKTAVTQPRRQQQKTLKTDIQIDRHACDTYRQHSLHTNYILISMQDLSIDIW